MQDCECEDSEGRLGAAAYGALRQFVISIMEMRKSLDIYMFVSEKTLWSATLSRSHRNLGDLVSEDCTLVIFKLVS